ncbi:MAG TPA: hypothetical protein VG432_15600 [Gemmatimonadaceae bacterium]|nr:hypothetical protein [Gemmatimonadaceae bacterium]
MTTPSTKRLALATIVVSTLAIGAAYASAYSAGGPPVWAGWLFAAGVTGALVATLALGAMRRDRGLGRLAGPFVLMTVMVGAGFIAVFALPDLGASEPLLLGLPRRAAIVLYGIGLLPTLVLPVAYALTFADQTLRPEDLARVLETARAARALRGDRDAQSIAAEKAS